MKALTIWQPWTSLIMAGAKTYEFRSWPAPKFVVGQRIVIHAGAPKEPWPAGKPTHWQPFPPPPKEHADG